MDGNTPIILVEKLVKQFADFQAVKGISFHVNKGERFAFLGPNGAGKTTTIKMLTTLLLPTSGSITLAGFNPQKQQEEVRRSFGIVFQDPSLDEELSAWENLDLHGVLYGVPSELRHTRMEELLHFVELWDRRHHFVKTFSGGMKRRLEIARGLLHHPKILFLDEPTIGLDPQTRNHMWEYVEKLNIEEHITIFFTTHYIEEAERVATRVAVIDHGQIIALGTSDELKKQTNQKTLEDAFLQLTGKEIRDEAASPIAAMRQQKTIWGRR